MAKRWADWIGVAGLATVLCVACTTDFDRFKPGEVVEAPPQSVTALDASGALGAEAGPQSAPEAGQESNPEAGTSDAAEACEPRPFYLDADRDGEGLASAVTHACVMPDGHVETATDCDDDCASCNAAGTEQCDGRDNDCDGTVDEATDEVCGTSVGVCEPGLRRCMAGALTECEGGQEGSDEVCDDSADEDCDGTVDEGCACSITEPRACGSALGECTEGTQACQGDWGPCMGGQGPVTETCDGKDNDCDEQVDEDLGTRNCGSDVGACAVGTERCMGGAWVCEGQTGPGDEVCDGADNDCDGMVDEVAPRSCGSAVGACMVGSERCMGGAWVCGGQTGPGNEVCDGADNDCDGTVDEGTKTAFYRDGDGDGVGAMDVTQLACAAPMGYVATAGDCVDDNPSVNPAAKEVCDGIDNNCDGAIDQGCACRNGASQPCETARAGTGVCRAGTQSCQDGQWGTCTGAVTASSEVCDHKDNDCDGGTDEGTLTTFYRDGDGDGRGDPSQSQQECTAATGYVRDQTDCDDTNPNAAPGKTEVCDGADNDCDGKTDEGTLKRYYLDGDSDGYGNSSLFQDACSAPSGYVTNRTDCDDGNRNASPGASERCDGVDNDCDRATDEPPSLGSLCPTGQTCTSGACRSNCGNGVLDPGEQCDDGNTTDGDNCDRQCRSFPYGVCDHSAGQPCYGGLGLCASGPTGVPGTCSPGCGDTGICPPFPSPITPGGPDRFRPSCVGFLCQIPCNAGTCPEGFACTNDYCWQK